MRLTSLKKKKEPKEKFDYENFVPPDGGFGWVVVVTAFFVQFIVLGIMNNFGILFTALIDDFKSSKQETSWVGSINYSVMFMTGPLTTSLCERLGCRPVAIIGGLIGALGTLLASFSTDIYKMYLTEGFLFGAGASMCYFPSVIILPQYFAKKLSLANGLVSCGSGVGTMVMGPILNQCMESFGWRFTVRCGSGALFVVSFLSLMYRPMVPPIASSTSDDYSQPLFDFSVFQNKAYNMLIAALFFFMLAYFIPFVHMTSLAKGLGIPSQQASMMIGFMSVSSTVGRLFFGKISDSPKVNRLMVYQISMLMMGIANTMCPMMKSFGGLLAYNVLFGFFEGCYVCQCAVLVGDIVGLDRIASGVGTLFGIKSIPLMLGPPLAGFLYDISNSYEVAFYIAGAVPIISALLMFFIPNLMPPKDHPFWKRRSHSSNEVVLISNNNLEAQACLENSQPIDTSLAPAVGVKQKDRIRSNTECVDSIDTSIPRKRSFNSSKHYLTVDLEKKVSTRELGYMGSMASMSSMSMLNIARRKRTASANRDGHANDKNSNV